MILVVFVQVATVLASVQPYPGFCRHASLFPPLPLEFAIAAFPFPHTCTAPLFRFFFCNFTIRTSKSPSSFTPDVAAALLCARSFLSLPSTFKYSEFEFDSKMLPPLAAGPLTFSTLAFRQQTSREGSQARRQLAGQQFSLV